MSADKDTANLMGIVFGESSSGVNHSHALMQKLIAEVPMPLTVSCPNCQAAPGQPCTQPTDMGRKAVTWFHIAREDAARTEGKGE